MGEGEGAPGRNSSLKPATSRAKDDFVFIRRSRSSHSESGLQPREYPPRLPGEGANLKTDTGRGAFRRRPQPQREPRACGWGGGEAGGRGGLREAPPRPARRARL